jgi:hypothetical protein
LCLIICGAVCGFTTSLSGCSRAHGSFIKIFVFRYMRIIYVIFVYGTSIKAVVIIRVNIHFLRRNVNSGLRTIWHVSVLMPEPLVSVRDLTAVVGWRWVLGSGAPLAPVVDEMPLERWKYLDFESA